MELWKERAELAEAQIERAMAMLDDVGCKGTLEARVALLLSLYQALEVENLELVRDRMRFTRWCNVEGGRGPGAKSAWSIAGHTALANFVMCGL
jgi:hypothetical protein